MLSSTRILRAYQQFSSSVARWQNRSENLEDLMQDSWLQVIAKYRESDFETTRQLLCLVYTILKRKTALAFRQRKMVNAVTNSSAIECIATSESSCGGESIVLAKLKPTDEIDREILKLRFHGFTNRSIALQLGIAESTVCRRLGALYTLYMKLLEDAP